MRNGMGYGEFEQLVRKSFVDVAYAELKAEGKKQTVSNVAILTGLNRKEVTRLRDLEAHITTGNSRHYNRLVRVLGGWANDINYLDQEGNPRDLEPEGLYSFSELVKSYSGDMPVVAMQKALIDSSNIIILENKQIRLLSRAYVPTSEQPEKIKILGVDTRQLIQTIDHNLSHSNDALRFQRKASNHLVDPQAVGEIEKIMKQKGQSFLEEMDALLSKHEVKSDDGIELSIAVFYHQSEDME